MVMRKFINALVVIPLGLFFVIFAVANRHLVTLSFDPFNSTTPVVAVTLPLFVVIIAVAMIGVAAGGMATWFRQGRWRRAARQHEADARQARAQLADLRTKASVAAPLGSSFGPSHDASFGGQQRLPAPLQGGFYGSAGRDKQGATL
jgi:uncharacterized integral membrane protein